MGRMNANEPQTELSSADEQNNSDSLDETVPMRVEPGQGGDQQVDQTDVQETQPVHPLQAASEDSPEVPQVPLESTPRRSRSWMLWASLGVLMLLLVAAGSSYSGYQAAVSDRLANQATMVFGDAQAQFDLGMQDLQAGRYELAQQRFEYVIRLDPNFPGVTDKLAEVLMISQITATPTLVPTPTLTPTPDLRTQQDLFAEAQSLVAAKDWTKAIDTLLSLRKADPNYHAVEIDGMLYISLRERGVDKIARQADLEGGTYDLGLAERFGPLDVEAKNWRDWAELYIRGASFWDVDWAQAVFYFGQLYLIAPNLMDASFYTSTDRYRDALIGYGDYLARQEEWCDAKDQYQLAKDVGGRPEIEPTATYLNEQCDNPQDQPSQPGGESGGEPGVENTPLPPVTTEVPPPTEAPPPTTGPTPYP